MNTESRGGRRDHPTGLLHCNDETAAPHAWRSGSLPFPPGWVTIPRSRHFIVSTWTGPGLATGDAGWVKPTLRQIRSWRTCVSKRFRREVSESERNRRPQWSAYCTRAGTIPMPSEISNSTRGCGHRTEGSTIVESKRSFRNRPARMMSRRNPKRYEELPNPECQRLRRRTLPCLIRQTRAPAPRREPADRLTPNQRWVQACCPPALRTKNHQHVPILARQTA